MRIPYKTFKSQRHFIEMALALQIENEDSTVLDPMVSLADITTPQACFHFNITVWVTGESTRSDTFVSLFTFEN